MKPHRANKVAGKRLRRRGFYAAAPKAPPVIL